MHKIMRSRVREGNGYSEEFGVKVFIRALSLARYSSLLCYRLYQGSSVQAALGFCCMQMTVVSMEEQPLRLGKQRLRGKIFE